MADTARGTAYLDADASGLEAGFADGKEAVRSFEQATKQASENVNRAVSSTGTAVDKSSSRQDAATKRLIATIRRYDEAIGKSRGELLEYRAVQAGIFSGEVAQQIARIKESEKAVINYGMSAKQTAAAMRMLPAQITDITTSLASGMPVWLVAIQQGGQIKDSFGGIGPALKAITGMFTPFRVAVAAAGAATAGLSAAFLAGEQESVKFRQALIQTGNVAGTTDGQLQDMAKRIASLGGTRGQAAAALTEIVSAGRFTSSQIENIGLAAVQMERVTGKAVRDTVREFVELAKAPTDASERLNETYNYLTESVYRQIRALEDQGRTQDAARVAVEAFASATSGRAQDMTRDLGLVERAWKGIKDAAAGAIDAIKDIGRPDTLQEQIRAAEAQVEFLQRRIDDGRGRVGTDARLDAARQMLESLRDESREAERFARQIAEQNQKREQGLQQTKALADFQKQYASDAQKITAEITRWKNLLGDSFTPDMESQIRSRLDRGGSQDDEATKTILRLKEQESALRAQLDVSEKLTQAEKERAAVLRQLDELQGKAVLTSAQQSLLGRADEIRAQLGINADLEREIRLRDDRNKREDEFQRLLTRSLESDDRLMKRRVENLQRARDAAEDYLDTIMRSQQRERESMTLGGFDRRRVEGRQQIEDRYADQFQRLARDRRRGQITDDEYDAEYAVLRNFQQRALESWEDHYLRLDEIRQNSGKGAEAAINSYVEHASDRFGQTKDLVENVFTGMEDALVQFVRTGKLSFSDLADAIIADLVRIEGRALISQAIMAMTGLGGTGGSGPVELGGWMSGLPGTRANGGPVSRGLPYMVGERGPELFVPSSSGNIIPHGAAGGVTVNQTINVGSADPNEVRRAAFASKEAAKAEIAELMYRGQM